MDTQAIVGLLKIIIMLFLFMIAGFIARKTGIINDTASKNLSKLVLAIGQPMMIVAALMGTECSLENLGQGGIIVAIGFGLHIFMAAYAFVACIKFKDLDERKITEFALVFTNCGFIGLPIYEALFKNVGDFGRFWGAFYIISFNVFLWTWGIAILARKRKDIKLTAKKILLNYGTVPSAVGILIYILLINVPGLYGSFAYDCVYGFCNSLGNLCTPISVLITGALLATRTPKQIFGSPKVYYLCLQKLIIMPLLICLIMKLLGFGPHYIIFAVAATAMPTAASASMLSELYDICPGYGSQAVGTSSLLSMASLPLVMLIAQAIVAL